MTDEQSPDETPVEVTVGAGDQARTVPVASEQVFIYAPAVLDTSDPITQGVLRRAADLVNRETQRAQRRSMSPGDWMRAKRERQENPPPPQETLVIVPTEAAQ